MQNDSLHNVEQSMRALGRAVPIMCIIGIVVGLIAYGIVRKTPPVYEVHFSYIVAQQHREAPLDFRFDGFYSLSATELFSSTLAELISSPEHVVQAYERAKLPLVTQDPINLAKNVVGVKSASQLVQVSVRSASKDGAERLAQGVKAVTSDIMQAYNADNIHSTQFTITASQPWTGVVQVAPMPVAIIAGVLALLVSAMLVLFRQALQRSAN